MRILVTGGAGYIGTHTCLELLAAGYELLVVDNLCNSKEESLNRVRELSGRSLDFLRADLRDLEALRGLFRTWSVAGVIHLAGLKAVGESVAKPLAYYDNNLGGTLNLCRAMAEAGVRQLVFSSTATVYGEPTRFPLQEDFPLGATNPYSRTKWMIEEVLRDLYRADPSLNLTLLRYFNPVGAHPSGRVGEDPQGYPNNLMPFITQVAVGKRAELQIFGDDYPTPDGTGVRDYLHVVDLARGHVQALKRLQDQPGCRAYNLGTGRGYSGLEVVRAFTEVNQVPIPYRIVARRPGDVPCLYADSSLAAAELGWRAELGLDAMVRDSWRWQSANPDGY